MRSLPKVLGRWASRWVGETGACKHAAGDGSSLSFQHRTGLAQYKVHSKVQSKEDKKGGSGEKTTSFGISCLGPFPTLLTTPT